MSIIKLKFLSFGFSFKKGVRMIQTLSTYISSLPSKGICVAFSGGVDSAVILKLAKLSHEHIIAVTFETFLHPNGDLAKAQAMAKDFQVPHYVIKIDELTNESILSNPKDRCYHCKYMFYKKMIEFSQKLGIDTILDGTNIDDLSEYRPGLKALSELHIISPLAECSLTKNQVRQIAYELKLDVANKPSTPCLATRVPYGVRLSRDILRKIDRAENILKDLGLGNIRVRYHNNLARIEVDQENFHQILVHKESIIIKLQELGFDYITLDLMGFRSGSMDIFNGGHNGY